MADTELFYVARMPLTKVNAWLTEADLERYVGAPIAPDVKVATLQDTSVGAAYDAAIARGERPRRPPQLQRAFQRELRNGQPAWRRVK